MHTDTWEQFGQKIFRLLESLEVNAAGSGPLEQNEGFALWRAWCNEIRKAERCLFFCGNGASASMASHFAADVAKNGQIRALVLTDPSLITAIGNDLSFDRVFSEPIEWWMQPSDMLIAISSSGNSPNVVKAVETALALKGRVVTLSAMKPDNAIRRLGSLNFFVPAPTYGEAETAHAAILHHWMNLMEASVTA